MDGGMTLKEQVRRLTERIEEGIRDVFASDRYGEYLKTMGRFHHYSVNNLILIHQQCPQATLVAGFDRWKKEFGRSVRKGEKGIRILAPSAVKRTITVEKKDPVTGKTILGPDGRAMTEDKEVELQLYRPVVVFDVSQTDGRELPSIVSPLNGSIERYEVFMEAAKRSSPVPVSMQDLAPGTDGFFSPADQEITLRSGMGQVQTLCAAIHEIAHAKLHNYTAAADERGEEVQRKERWKEEVEAESVAYAVCQYFGIETAENSLGYIAGWAGGKDVEELRRSLETISQTVSGLITDMERHIGEICTERGIEAQNEERIPTVKVVKMHVSHDLKYIPQQIDMVNVGKTSVLKHLREKEAEAERTAPAKDAGAAGRDMTRD